eukprot:TRINITY_DN13367_c0_g2_i2.p1 TRINITY_DN13367_c0_g2~~TRINITY_DN13367_c0_g2_i2.p1  ORF type:complete len:351 (-),score=-12.50 TRINITY_DN13367_c0_g2_i2:86-1138(-)
MCFKHPVFCVFKITYYVILLCFELFQVLVGYLKSLGALKRMVRLCSQIRYLESQICVCCVLLSKATHFFVQFSLYLENLNTVNSGILDKSVYKPRSLYSGASSTTNFSSLFVPFVREKFAFVLNSTRVQAAAFTQVRLVQGLFRDFDQISSTQIPELMVLCKIFDKQYTNNRADTRQYFLLSKCFFTTRFCMYIYHSIGHIYKIQCQKINFNSKYQIVLIFSYDVIFYFIFMFFLTFGVCGDLANSESVHVEYRGNLKDNFNSFVVCSIFQRVVTVCLKIFYFTILLLSLLLSYRNILKIYMFQNIYDLCFFEKILIMLHLTKKIKKIGNTCKKEIRNNFCEREMNKKII